MHIFGNDPTVTNLIWIFVALIFIMVFVVVPIKQRKDFKKDRESHRQFLENLNVGDKVLLSVGIYGVVRRKEESVYHIEISKNVLIEVLPQSIVGKDKRTN